jgi:hypothetical protein
MLRLAPSLALLGVALFAPACASRPILCSAPDSCGDKAACVSSRCVPDAGVSALATTRRLVFDPIDVAFIERGGASRPGELPVSVTLGRAGAGPAAVLLRFEVPADLDIVEAYLLIDHTEDARMTDAPVGVHAERIVEHWSARSVTWLQGPALRDVHAPSSSVRRGSPVRVRIDVRPLFLRPHGEELPDQGIALVADRTTPSGATVVLVSGLAGSLPGDPDPGDGSELRAPRLELYVK